MIVMWPENDICHTHTLIKYGKWSKIVIYTGLHGVVFQKT